MFQEPKTRPERAALMVRFAADLMGRTIPDSQVEAMAHVLTEYDEGRLKRAFHRVVRECEFLNLKNILDRLPAPMRAERPRPEHYGPLRPPETVGIRIGRRRPLAPLSAPHRPNDPSRLAVPPAIKELAARRAKGVHLSK